MKVFGIGGSMRPFIRNGSILTVDSSWLAVDSKEKRVHGSRFTVHGQYKRGDVILYRIGEQRLIHRIVGLESNGYWIDDDAGIVGRHFVRRKDVIGKVKMPWYLEGFLGHILSLITRTVYSFGRNAKGVLCAHMF